MNFVWTVIKIIPFTFSLLIFGCASNPEKYMRMP